MKKLKFFKCKHCGNVVAKLVDKDVSIFCCGGEMEEIVANTTEASTEKHLPVVAIKDGLAEIKIGSVPHPMEKEHFINFIAVETDANCIISCLQPETKPEAKIYVGNSKIISVYEYCNLHGLWKTKVI